MDKNEEYVRSVWPDVGFASGDNSIIPGAGFVSADVMALTTIKSSPEQAWAEAATFTRERLEEGNRGIGHLHRKPAVVGYSSC